MGPVISNRITEWLKLGETSGGLPLVLLISWVPISIYWCVGLFIPRCRTSHFLAPDFSLVSGIWDYRRPVLLVRTEAKKAFCISMSCVTRSPISLSSGLQVSLTVLFLPMYLQKHFLLSLNIPCQIQFQLGFSLTNLT